jgi:hypothetical protein
MWKLALLLVAFGACHAAMDDMNSMRGYIDDTRRETTRHLDAARAALTMQDMRSEMAQHRDGMTPMMGDIDVTMDSMMSHCDGGGLGDMRAMHGELDGEMAQHLAMMDASLELPAAQAEVERHGATMMTMMDGMNGAMTRMSCQ